MALEINAINVLIGVGVAIFANTIWGVLGWIKSNEPFNPRQFSATIITAVLVGVGAGIVAVPQISAAANQVDLIVVYLLLFTGPIAADAIRNKVSGAIANNKASESTETKVESA